MILILIALALISGASADSISDYDIHLEGFIKASPVYSDSPIGSYENINLVAPTHALPESVIREEGSRTSFQTQQSRFGMVILKGASSGKFEFDFVDFRKASPTTQMVPRVRIASITHTWDEYTIIAGQDWDLFSPVGGFSFNFIGNYFLAGNTGFMRPQIILMKNENNWEWGAAVGLAAANPEMVETNLERGKSPSYSFRTGHIGPNVRAGISLIYSSLAFYENGAGRRDAYGQNLFYEQRFSWGEVRSEIYYGQNLANLGTLSIGKGNAERDVRELGGFVSAKIPVNDRNSLIGSFGIAKIDNQNALRPFSLNETNSLADLGIHENQVIRMGHEFQITESLFWNSEITRFKTIIKLTAERLSRHHAHTVESGLLLRF